MRKKIFSSGILKSIAHRRRVSMAKGQLVKTEMDNMLQSRYYLGSNFGTDSWIPFEDAKEAEGLRAKLGGIFYPNMPEENKEIAATIIKRLRELYS